MTTLVTGANGHLGNNVVRALLARGNPVRASVRNTSKTEPFAGINPELVYADLLDKDSLLKAMEGVETLYQVAAVFKHWSKNPEQDIIKPAVEGTRNVMEAAAEKGVKRIVYVSSSVTLDDKQMLTQGKMDENGWRTETYGNPYYVAKIESEKLAWELAEKHNLDMVSVLPVAILGPHCYNLTPTMNILAMILKGELYFDVNFTFSFVDVRDVAAGMLAAAEKGRSGERYILAGTSAMSTGDVVEIARAYNSKVPRTFKVPRPMLMGMASLMELGGQVTGQEPLILRSQVQLYYGMEENIDISKARRELGYDPRPSEQAVREALAYLQQRG